MQRRVLGAEHPDTLRTIGYLVKSLSCLSKYEEAAQMQRELLEVRQRILDPMLNIRPREPLGACPSASQSRANLDSELDSESNERHRQY